MKKNVLILFGLLLCSSTCVMDPDQGYTKYSLTIINKSKIDICFLISSSFPDTTLPKTPYILEHPEIKYQSIIKSNDQIKTDFRDIIDTTVIFLLNDSIVDHTIWDSIRKNYIILKRFDLSLDDFKNMNWTITYP